YWSASADSALCHTVDCRIRQLAPRTSATLSVTRMAAARVILGSSCFLRIIRLVCALAPPAPSLFSPPGHIPPRAGASPRYVGKRPVLARQWSPGAPPRFDHARTQPAAADQHSGPRDRKSTRLNSSH